ncbi:hypothetical protein FRZ06_05705 [Anoxybacterium hadale]|uniref:Uncharacterized protein n=1 Tax=Anoxybacterium hadale TaxID=3408580 RepID=A0ACD1A9A3_9FIRM|nr:hypothetical protein FRZ06_05705 [Clostridiales bacterium]
MKRRLWLILGVSGALITSYTALFLLQSGAAEQTIHDPVILKTNENEYTESEVRARMALYCQKYSFSMEQLHDDPAFWNQMVDDIVYEYASSEIARELCIQEEPGVLNETEQKEAQAYFDTLLADIDGMGESQNSYLEKLGFTQDTLWTLSENQAYAARLLNYWSQDLVHSGDASKKNYEDLLNYTRRMWDEIHARVDRGEYVINQSPLLQVVTTQKEE